MAKLSSLLAAVLFLHVAAAPLYAHALASDSNDQSPLLVTGRVYCDACGAGHFAKSSFFVAGAKVAVQCGSGQVQGHVTAYVEGKTDGEGGFEIPVGGEHEHDYCVALLLHTSHPTCNILTRRTFARVLLTRNAGLANDIINTGPFSFKPSRVAPSCAAQLAAEASVGGE